MNDNYLWDGSGEPNPEIRRLENALGRFRDNRPAPDFRTLTQATLTLPAPRRVRISFFAAFAGMAAAALLAVGVVKYENSLHRPSISHSAWNVATKEGAPRIGTKMIGINGQSAALQAGETLETDENSRATISTTPPVKSTSIRTRACAPSNRVPVRSVSPSIAAQFTPRFGRPRAASSWIRLQPLPWISAASIRSTWTIRARDFCKLHSAGLASSSTAMNPSSRQARPARRIQFQVPARPISKTLQQNCVKLSHNSIPEAQRPRSAAPHSESFSLKLANAMHSHSGIYSRARMNRIDRASLTGSHRSFPLQPA